MEKNFSTVDSENSEIKFCLIFYSKSQMIYKSAKNYTHTANLIVLYRSDATKPSPKAKPSNGCLQGVLVPHPIESMQLIKTLPDRFLGG